MVFLPRRGGTKKLHLPIWVRVIPNPQIKKQVLLIDDDGSSAGTGLADYSAVHKGILDRLRVTYGYVDAVTGGLAAVNPLPRDQAGGSVPGGAPRARPHGASPAH